MYLTKTGAVSSPKEDKKDDIKPIGPAPVMVRNMSIPNGSIPNPGSLRLVCWFCWELSVWV